MNQDLKKTLWAAADKLRSSMDAAEYKHKTLLRRYSCKYPPDKQDEATETVLRQAERLSEEWVGA